MGNKTLYSVCCGTCPGESWDPFTPSFSRVKTIINPDEISEINSALVLWGGEDISASFYNQINMITDTTDLVSKRDALEKTMVERCIELKIPMIGVCRGAQLLCALAGGKLWQHVNNHGNSHVLLLDENHRFEGKDRILSNSVHHQMMYPYGIPHKMIAVAFPRRASKYCSPDPEMISPPEVEPEIVWFPTIRGLAIQGHPEFMDSNNDFVKYCNQLVQKYIYEAENTHAE